jgi:hypothetical protein
LPEGEVLARPLFGRYWGQSGPGFRDPGVIKNGLTTSSVTQRDDEKLETPTAPNPRPLLVDFDCKHFEISML